MVEILTTKYFDNWIRSLKNKDAQTRIQARIRRIESSENFGDIKPVGENVFEIRIDCGTGYRVYYLKLEKLVIVLLCGGDKSTQSRDIDKAHEIAKMVKVKYEK
jgi:putative addiction module killer protein